MTDVMVHPCQYSPEVLVAFRDLIREGERVHDPFAGTGHRLAALCDEIEAIYSGTDIEDWPGHDPRVVVADALDPASYPSESFTVVTSPVYQNKRLADYRNGPTPTTKTKGRRDYGISLGRALDGRNLARHTGRPNAAGAYYSTHRTAISNWGARVIVNVDGPISNGWQLALSQEGYKIENVVPVRTQRYGGLHNAEKRAEFEVVIIAVKAGET